MKIFFFFFFFKKIFLLLFWEGKEGRSQTVVFGGREGTSGSHASVFVFKYCLCFVNQKVFVIQFFLNI